MKGFDVALILLGTVTIVAVAVALRTTLFIRDGRERAYQAIHFLLGIIIGYVLATPLVGIMVGTGKELGAITLAIMRGLPTEEKFVGGMRAIMFWTLGAFFGSESLERIHNSVPFIIDTFK